MNKRPISGRLRDRLYLARLPYVPFSGLGLILVFYAACCGLGGQALAGPVSVGHKLQVDDAALAGQLEAQGARLVADYGGFQLLETPSITPDLATNRHVEVRDEHNFILLNSAWLDTTRPEVRSLRKAAGTFGGKRLHLVQFAGPIRSDWRAQLLSSGVQLVSYIPHNTYLVYGDAQGIARVQAMAAAGPQFQWDGTYEAQYKIHPAAKLVDENGNAHSIGTDEFAVQLSADADGNTNTVQLLDGLKLEPFKQAYHILNYYNIIVGLPAASLETLAAQPDVISIQPHFPRKKFCERQDQIVAGNLSGGSPSGPGYLAWLASKGFTQAQFAASGFVVDIADSGLDNGTTSPNHLGLHTGGILTNSSRVLYNRLQGTPNPGSTLSGCDGHGTLNSHIVGGYNALSGFPHTDASGFHYGLGVCPFVLLGSSVIFDPNSYTYPDFTNLVSSAYHSGARISNNSWGASTSGTYDVDAQTYDVLVRDAEPTGAPYPAGGNQEMVIVFAAGNDGSLPQTVGSPGTAKNVITVGASENVQAFGGADGSGVTDTDADNANDILYFSSRGPCTDGRHKPELVAPGSHVSGGVDQAANPSSTGTAASCFDGSGVSGGPASSSSYPYFPANQQFYTASSGTSHSTPCVSGGCALLRQYFINNGTNPPSAAMTKAYLMNSARYLNGVSANDNLWSDNQGMGEMNLGTAFDGVARILRDQLPADLFTASGQTRTFTGVISDTNKPFRVTVAWTDAPGSTTGNAYNNDLDLTVTVGGQTYRGNVFSGAYSVTGGSADTANNVESAFLPAGVSGSFVVTVTAANINSDGVPNNSYPLDQDFALVIYNANAQMVPLINGAGATLQAESCLPTNGVVDPGETVTLNFMLQNSGTANTTNLVATLLPSGGISSPSGPQPYGVLTAGGSAVGRAFTFASTGSCGDTNIATLLLQDGLASLGSVSFNLRLGTPAAPLVQNFDAVAAPALPSGWSSAVSGSVPGWGTSSSAADTLPYAAFAPDSTNSGVSELISPNIPISTASAQLSFRNNFDLEALVNRGVSSWTTNPYDGGVLEIKIGGGAFTDILAAGGSFVSGGYVGSISSSGGNPLAGRMAWSGSSGGFITTRVNLPASAAGQTIRLKWRLGTDSGNYYGGTGWYIDSLALSDGFACCTPGVDLAAAQNSLPEPPIVDESLTFTITVANRGSTDAAGVIVTDALPANVTFVSSSLGTGVAGTVVCPVRGLTAGSTTNITITVTPVAVGSLTNVVTVGADTPDSNFANNTSVEITSVQLPPFPVTSPDHLGLMITGKGAVSPNYSNAPLQMGKQYTVTAKPAKGYILSNWVGGVFPALRVVGEKTRFSFTMQQGFVLEANFVPNPFLATAGSYAGLFFNTNGIALASAGSFKATVRNTGSFSAKLQSAGASYSVSGIFTAGGVYSNVVPRKSLTPLSVQLQLDLNGQNAINGVLGDGAWVAELSANRAVYSRVNPAPQGSSKYTLGIPGSLDAAQPAGWGYGALSLEPLGNVRFAGALADGSKVSQATFLSAAAQWPLYASLYSGKGLVIGWLTLSNQMDTDVSGLVSWIKAADAKAKLYPAGFEFTNGVEVIGSHYNGTPSLNLGAGGILILDGGGLPESETNAVSSSAGNKLTGANKSSVTISAGTGFFRGSAWDGGTKPATVNGALLQKQNVGYGYFISTNQSGRVYLGPAGP